jgi:hypothetical protein
MMARLPAPPVSRSAKKRSSPACITPEDGARIGGAGLHERIQEQSKHTPVVRDLRAPGAAMACSCGARIRRSCANRAKPPVRVPPGIQDPFGTLERATPQHRRGAQQISNPPRDTHTFVRLKPLPVSVREERNNTGSIVLSKRLIIMSPECAVWRSIFARPSCPAKSSSQVIHRCVRQLRKINDKHLRRQPVF